MRLSTRSAAAVSIATVFALFFSGCSSASPDFTPLPAAPEADHSPGSTTAPVPTDPPITTPAPQSAGEAVEMGTAALEAYMKVLNETLNSNPTDMSTVQEVARERALEEVKAAGQTLADSGVTRSGTQTLSLDDARTEVSDDDEGPSGTLKYVYVEFWTCIDSSNISYSTPTTEVGNVGEYGQTVFPVWYLVHFNHEDQTWYVSDLVSNPEGGGPC